MKRLFFLVCALIWATGNFAQQKAATPKSKTALHANRLRIHEIVPGAIIWPKLPDNKTDYTQPPITVDFDGSPKPSAGVQAAGLWLGGLDTAGQVRVSCANYNYNTGNYPFVAGPLSGDWPTDSLNAIRWDRFFKVGRTELEMHRADWVDNGMLDNPLPTIVGWPGRGNPHFAAQYGFPLPGGEYAPFVDINGDSIYNAFDGDYPHPPSLDPEIVPGEIIWNVFNDAYGDFLDVPPGVEVHSTAWALACEGDNLLNETVFFSYRIINRSGITLDSVVAALWMDPNIGAFEDDYWGTQPTLNTIFTYNRNGKDTNYLSYNSPYAFGLNPPVTSFTFLNRPLYKSMYHMLLQVCDPITQMLEPQDAEEFYNNLHGKWRNGKPLVYGGTGYDYNNEGLPSTNFAFPGDPNVDSSWSMTNSNNICSFMAASVPSIFIGTLPSDSVFIFETAFSFHRSPGLNNLQNVTYCFDRVTQLQQLYDENFSGACTYPESCMDDCVWPGDFDRDGIVSLRDVLPLGVGWKSDGAERAGLITWAPHTAANWNISFNNEYDFKHLDANGDGTTDSLDLKVMQVFEGLFVPGYVAPVDTYVVGDGLWMTHFTGTQTDPDNVQTGQFARVRVQVGDAPGLYGVAFETEFDTTYWKLHSIPNASPVSDLRLSKQKTDGIEIAAVYTDSSNGFVASQHLLTFILRAKAIPDSLPDTTLVRIKNIRGIRADGSEIPMSANYLRYCFGGGCPAYVGTEEVRMKRVIAYPNPSTGRLTLVAPEMSWESIEAFDPAGRLLRRWDEPGSEQTDLDLTGMAMGWVLLRVKGRDWVGQQRVFLLR